MACETIEVESFYTAHIDSVSTARPGRVYALLGMSEQAQREFARRQLPALILGSNYADVDLPSIDADYPAVALHAVSLIQRNEYERIILLLPETPLTGDLATEHKLTECARSAGLEIETIHHRPGPHQPDQIARYLRQARKRTVVFTCKPTLTIGLMLALLRQGISVPAHTGILSRDADPVFLNVSPVVSCYDCHRETLTDRAAELLLRLSRGEHIRNRQVRIIPDYIAGGTLEPRPRPFGDN